MDREGGRRTDGARGFLAGETALQNAVAGSMPSSELTGVGAAKPRGADRDVASTSDFITHRRRFLSCHGDTGQARGADDGRNHEQEAGGTRGLGPPGVISL